MPVFFLHLRNGTEVTEDLEGEIFDDLASAKREALQGAREIMADHLRYGEALGVRREFVISDEVGNLLSTVPFSAAIQRD